MVRASAVYDISVDIPRSGEHIFVDTNAWLPLVYTGAQAGSVVANRLYASYLGKCKTRGVSLLFSALTFSELAHLIEKAECDLHNAMLSPEKKCTLKQFRSGEEQRRGVIAEARNAWQQVSSMARALVTPTDDDALCAAIDLFENCALDGYDVFFVNAMRISGITHILTNDGDFLSVPGLTIHTANSSSLRLASLFKIATAR